ncbi:hypothetical protein [Natronolimnohabitans innermongolicus]|uniref:Solute carrier family 5 (Low affinity glucose cotransporter), member 4-like protein n=1 Tax=Natronolimnohabitans innermongolicus JCM 12255 TaxID=1227499 RepID=L9WY08_9EURY|nr:hypothetical protein [Natronolimnohabitans innermongolicus]ELY54046.1 hypothetical protein C493_13388 [Natronolimnohabitans innermongolicus JCM 12255]
MELSPEEYGAYWRSSIFVAAGVSIVVFGYRLLSPLLSGPTVGAIGIAVFLLLALILAGTYVAMIGVARAVRTAVDAEMRG